MHRRANWAMKMRFWPRALSFEYTEEKRNTWCKQISDGKSVDLSKMLTQPICPDVARAGREKWKYLTFPSCTIKNFWVQKKTWRTSDKEPQECLTRGNTQSLDGCTDNEKERRKKPLKELIRKCIMYTKTKRRKGEREKTLHLRKRNKSEIWNRSLSISVGGGGGGNRTQG